MKIMKQTCRKGTAIMLTLLMMLALVPQYTYASTYGATPRSASLDLTGEVVSYTASGGTENADPTEGNITDSVEGWKWYRSGDGEKGYAPLTLELSGINLVTGDPVGITLPAGTTIVLVDNTENIVKSTFTGTFGGAASYGILCKGNLTIKGDSGALTTIGSGADRGGTSGVMAEGSLSIQGGHITAVGGLAFGSVISTGLRANQNITITGGTIYAITDHSQSSRAVYVANWYIPPGYSLILDGMEAYQKNKINDEYTVKARVSNGGFVFSEPPYDNLAANDVRITPLPTASFSGQGTEADPYLITSKEELKEMAQFVNDQNGRYGNKYYKLTADIVLNEDMENDPEQWEPIGDSMPFTGSFDGDGHTISGLYIATDSISQGFLGLFGTIQGGTVKNLGLIDGRVLSISWYASVGSLAGFVSNGRIEDCYNTGAVTGKSVGGIVGLNSGGHIQDCYNTGEISGLGNYCAAGGIAGQNMNASDTIVNCYNTGNVTISLSNEYDQGYVGGITGQNGGSSIRNCYNTGVLSSEAPEDAYVFMGAIAGASDLGEDGVIEDAYWLDTAGTAIGMEPDSGSGYSGTDSSSGCTPMTEAEMKAGAFVDMLNSNVDDLQNTYATLSPWKADTNNTNGGYPVFGTAVQNGSDSGSSGGHGSSGKSDNANTANIVVNGKAQSAGKSETVTGADGKTTTTVTVDSDKLKSLLSAEKNGAKVTIPVADSASTAEGRLTGEMVKSMEDKRATLIIQRGASSYTLPAAEINISEISRQLGTSVSLSDITVSVKISEPSNAMAKMVETAEQSKGFTVVAPAVDFTITCTYGGKSVTSSSFNAYVERTIAIPAGVDPSKITTGIVVEPNGTVYHVPTRVTVIDGKYYAVINSLTNSTYSVIWNPVTFSDMANHWAKDSVNNMGSRMVVTGVGNNNYAPGRNMTRAEFSAVIVRALGLAPASGSSNFSDIKTSDWYNGYIETAVSYGIIKGYDNGKFGPNDTITREQAMTILARAMKVTGLNADLTDKNVSELIGAYTDGTAVSAYAKESVAACLETGITAGRSNQIIAPKDSITRAEVAIMAERLLKKSDLI
ncbi:S-layer homology domain-containing protein [Clostridium aminobutyricum]|uniref:S-layer homology domain-containing protein n=1 Tax=Clostridium aminobutyricum TaxID=33953 RepID=A0A939D984_CLOAM|nr:S-layer homology domain-containing protein [Clostridium aminobutyricum]MBN7773536.1 S-layer homology domain-containing protein [Clostridium aminobutyricum]